MIDALVSTILMLAATLATSCTSTGARLDPADALARAADDSACFAAGVKLGLDFKAMPVDQVATKVATLTLNSPATNNR